MLFKTKSTTTYWSHLPSLFLLGAIKGMMPTSQQWGSWLWLSHVLLSQKRATMLKGGISRECLRAGCDQCSQCLTHSGFSWWQAAFSKFIAREFITMTRGLAHQQATGNNSISPSPDSTEPIAETPSTQALRKSQAVLKTLNILWERAVLHLTLKEQTWFNFCQHLIFLLPKVTSSPSWLKSKEVKKYSQLQPYFSRTTHLSSTVWPLPSEHCLCHPQLASKDKSQTSEDNTQHQGLLLHPHWFINSKVRVKYSFKIIWTKKPQSHR